MRLRWLSTKLKNNRSEAAIAPSTLYWRMLGALVLGVVLARWSWLLFSPHATAVAVVPEHGAATEAGLLFGIPPVVTAPAASAVEDTVSSNLRLVGVFAGRMGQPGFAVLKVDDKSQVGVAVGENVVPGTKLLEAHSDYVVLEHSGIKQRVKLVVKAVVPTVAAAPVPRNSETNEKE